MKLKSNLSLRSHSSHCFIVFSSLGLLAACTSSGQAARDQNRPMTSESRPAQIQSKTVIQTMGEAGIKPGVIRSHEGTTAQRITVIQTIRQRWGKEELRNWVRVKRRQNEGTGN